VIVGFPANNFGSQEPGTDQEIKTFCEPHYKVTFQCTARSRSRAPTWRHWYDYLTKATGGDINGNFTKILVGRTGPLSRALKPATKPESPEVAAAVEKALADNAEASEPHLAVTARLSGSNDGDPRRGAGPCARRLGSFADHIGLPDRRWSSSCASCATNREAPSSDSL